jgi:hypothetical protein
MPGASIVRGSVWAVVLLLALSACGGHDSADSGASSASTALPQATKSADPTRFVRRWLAAEVRMETTGRIGPYLALSKSCQDCQILAHAVARYYAAGGYIKGGAWRVRRITLTPTGGGSTLVTVHASSAPTTIKVSSSEPAQHFHVRQGTLYLRVASDSRSYTVTSRTEG